MKKQLRLVLAFFALTLGWTSASAQTDVTSTYLTNADFATNPAINMEGTAVSEASSTNTITPTGWTDNSSGSWPRYGALPLGYSGTKYGFMNDTYPPTSDDDHTGYTLAISGSWGSTPMIFQTSKVELPVGYYELTVEVYNNSTITAALQGNKIAVYSDAEMTTALAIATTTVYPSNNWKKETLSFSITETQNVTFALGIYGNSQGAGSNQKLFLSNLKLTWTDPLQAAKDALQAEIDKAKTCDEKEGLADAIAAAENALNTATTAEELAEALAALQAADKDPLLRKENGLTDASATNGMQTNFVINGTFTDNVNGWTATGGFQNSNRASNQNGDFTVPFWENWNGSAKANKMYQTINNIPNGTYKLKIAAFVNTLADSNESQFVFANNDKTYLTTTDPTFYEVWTVVTDNKVEIGLEQTTATANWMGIDNVSLTYYGAGDVINEAQMGSHKTNWDEALAAAKTAVADEAYANVTGKELADLNAEIAKAEPSTAEGYDEATIALRNATTSFTAAKTNYDIFAAYNKELSYADASKKPVIDNTTTATTLISALRAYYESHALAEGVEDAVNMTAKIANATDPTNNESWTWTGSKNNPASNESWTDADGTNTHSYFDGGNWGANSWTTTMKQTVNIPAGKYLLTAKARAAANVTFTMTAGEASVELPHIGSTGNVFDRGWGDASVEFETDGNPAEILVRASTSTQYEWFSISDFRLVQLEAIEVPMADADDYEALAASISAAEAKTLGFDADEYAPYNNVTALQALAAAKAINPEAEDGNTKEVVQNATTALKTATWTANTEEVNAVYNGMFATVQEGANYPEGWNRTNAWGQMQSNIAGDYATAYYNQPGSLKYGENDVYTMPLKANTAYRLTFAYRSHENNSNNNVTVSVLNGEDGLSNKVFEGNGSTSEWRTGSVVFTTGDAGNYVLTLANSGNTWMTNVSILKAILEEVTLDDAATEAPANAYANVTYARTLAAGYNSLVLPFEVTKEEIGGNAVEEIYAYNGCTVTGEGDDAVYHLDFQKGVETLAANTPYLVKMKEEKTGLSFEGKTIAPAVAEVANDNFSFVGTYVAFAKDAENNPIVAGDYISVAAGLKKAAGGNKLNAFRAYLKNKTGITNANVKINVNGEEVDAITAIEINNALNNGIYNLQGQKVNAAQKGIYIVNGKKIVVK